MILPLGLGKLLHDIFRFKQQGETGLVRLGKGAF
jgi:hypothetical protein